MALRGDESGGAVFADYDNDGKTDLLVLGYRGLHLFHNEGTDGFRDVTPRSGIVPEGMG